MTPEEYKQFLKDEYKLDGQDLEDAIMLCKLVKGTIVRVWDHK